MKAGCPLPVFLAAAALLAGLFSSSPAPAAEEPEATGSDLASWLTMDRVYDPPDPFRRRSIVLLHGFGGSPYDLKPLFDALQGEGFRLLAPLLPGEGAEAERMAPPQSGAVIEWLFQLLTVEEALFGRKPYLVGFSKGGSLASLAASEGRAGRVVLVAPYYGLAHGDEIIEKGTRAVAPLLKRVPKPWKGRVNDPAGYAKYEPGQKSVPLENFLQLQSLARRARQALAGPLPVPVLVLASPDDDVASWEETERIFAGKAGATLRSYPGSNHILFYDVGAGQAVSAARDFLVAPDAP